MREKVTASIKHLILLSLLLFIGYSCSDSTQDYLDEYEIRRMIEEEIRKNNLDLEFTKWEIVNVTINQGDWNWIEEAGRYEAFVDLPELTKFVYENGAQLGYVFIGQPEVDEVQKIMPFVQTYYEEDNQGNPILYTETISCDFQYGSPSSAAFYIQASDLGRDDTILGNYNFRIVLIW